MRTDLDVPARALAVVAHPDDAEFRCGATLAKWAAAGCVVHHLVCTDGSKGTWDVDADTTALVARRRDEQREAARRLGATGEVRFLDAVDGELEASLARRGEVARIIRELQPVVVLGHDPWRRWRLHPDHRAAGFLAVDGVVAARDPHFHPEHDLPHHRPEVLLLFETEVVDHLEVVGEDHAAAKVDALLAHETQYVTTHGIGPDDDGTQRAAFAAAVDARLRETGRRAGVGRAEGFHRIDDL